MTSPDIDTWRLFWAKTDRSGERPDWTRPLWAHLLDVANAADALWPTLPEAVRERLATYLGLRELEARRLLTLLVGLHDAGKATPAFQHLHAPSAERLAECGLDFLDELPVIHHGHASLPILHTWLGRTPETESVRRLLYSLVAFVGFHHGRLRPRERKARPGHWSGDAEKIGSAAWRREQQQMVEEVASAWLGELGWPKPREPRLASFPPELLAFAGWTTLADWVGSMAEYMPDVRHGEALTGYLTESRAEIQKALGATGLDCLPIFRCLPFRDAFPEVFAGHPNREPRALQRRVIDADLPDGPCLSIIEAPTGEGKTEAAFYLAARLQHRHQQGARPAQGVYVAMPTQASSNGLFPRFEQFLRHVHDATDGDAVLRLTHGAAALNLDQRRLLDAPDTLTSIYNEDVLAPEARVQTPRWFAPSRRALLAPYGVGTVDQAFLGVLLARHFFLRLYALAGKTVIFDEVHAYDGYMKHLFLRLLRWLRALGSDVVVLSATLPTPLRDEMLAAWDSRPVPEAQRARYPAIVVAGDREAEVLPSFVPRPQRPITIRLVEADTSAVVERVAAGVRGGATIAVIVNLVRRAQDLYDALEKRLDLPAEDFILLHARFPFEERQGRERRVLKRFGKERPARPGVLIATQVAEQSLDLDADWMLSDLAPVDLLLQRAGRLHRHADLDSTRPPSFSDPELVVLRPEPQAAGILPSTSKIGGGSVYLDLPLFRTIRLLEDGMTWRFPGAYRELVEAVYNPPFETPPGLSQEDQERWEMALKVAGGVERDEVNEAYKRLIPESQHLRQLVDSPAYAQRAARDEDDVGLHEDLRPLTRLGGPSVEVVCLHRNSDGNLYLGAACQDQDLAPLGRALDHADAERLLRRSVRLSRRDLASYFLQRDTFPEVEGWDRMATGTPALRYHRPLVFRDGRCTDLPSPPAIRLCPALGVVYEDLHGNRL